MIIIDSFTTKGQVVAILGRQTNEYKVLGIGKVIQVASNATGFSPGDSIPVQIFHVEVCATNILSQGQILLWPKLLLASYNPSSTQASTPQDSTPSELKSNISSIPPDEMEDELLNYGLQIGCFSNAAE